MTGQELTDRLIDDLNTTIKIRSKVTDPFTQIRQLGLTGKYDIKDFWSALNVQDFDAHLDILSQFINTNERLVDHDKGKKVDIGSFHRDVNANRKKIGEMFQQVIDNKGLVDLISGKPISEFLVQQLDWIHSSTN